MPNATFDILKFTRALRDAGVPEKQAEAEATVLAEVFSINFRDVTTKDDLKHAVEAVEVKIRETELRLSARIDQLGGQVNGRIDQLDRLVNSRIDNSEVKVASQFDLVRSEMREMEQRLLSKIDKVDGRIDQQNVSMNHIKWLLGLLVTLCVSIAIRTIFFLGK